MMAAQRVHVDKVQCPLLTQPCTLDDFLTINDTEKRCVNNRNQLFSDRMMMIMGRSKTTQPVRG